MKHIDLFFRTYVEFLWVLLLYCLLFFVFSTWFCMIQWIIPIVYRVLHYNMHKYILCESDSMVNICANIFAITLSTCTMTYREILEKQKNGQKLSKDGNRRMKMVKKVFDMEIYCHKDLESIHRCSVSLFLSFFLLLCSNQNGNDDIFKWCDRLSLRLYVVWV